MRVLSRSHFLMIYLVVILLLFYLSYTYDICGKTKGEKGWYITIQVILILLAGLRYRVGIDTTNYIFRFYYLYPSLSDFSLYDCSISSSPFFTLLNSFVISLGGRFYIVQLINAIFVIVLIFNYFDRHSKYIFTCSLFYFIVCFFEYNMEIMRANMCITICLYGNDYVLNRKWVKGYLMYFIALLFHIQAILFFFLPLILKLRLELNRKGYFFLVITFVVGYLIQNAFGNYLTLLELADGDVQTKLNGYGVSEYFNTARNLNYMIVYYFPLLFYTMASVAYVNKKSSDNELILLQPFVMIGLVFQVLQMTLFMAYRFTEFFYVYMLMYMANMFIDVARNMGKSSNYRGFVRVLIVFLPFFFLTFYSFRSYNVWRYIPYASVIDRKIDKNRETEFSLQNQPPYNLNEY